MGFFKKLYAELEECGIFPNNGPEFDGPEPSSGAPQELLDAEERCPEIQFVQSCRSFFEKRGFLSAKQKNALRYAGTPNRRKRYEYGYEPTYKEDDYDNDDGFGPWG